ncbi:hypothetical protein AGMMS49992_26930 [Clostridia bacterium]|nr:hypothetical protein AGMMS49992_26930 [Clostridia bacterium]
MGDRKCLACGSEELAVRINGPHVEEYCAKCGKYQRFIKQLQNIETGEMASDSQGGYARFLMQRTLETKSALTARQAGAIIAALKKG